jgi:hypothetical protein
MSDASDLHREVGELQATVAILTNEVTTLRKQVEDLVAILNQGKGAKYMIFMVPAFVGLLSSALGYFGFHASFTNTGH